MNEIKDIRLDIETLLALMEKLDDGRAGDDIMLRACSHVLAERYARLAQTERVAAEQ
jgi:hypothetical protein